MLTFVWREAHRVEMATCPNWVLSCVGRAVAIPNQDSPGCRWCHGAGMMPLVASDCSEEWGRWESEVRVHLSGRLPV